MPVQQEAEVRQQIDKLVEGIASKDLDGLKRLYATDVVSFDVNSAANGRTVLAGRLAGSSVRRT